MLKRYMLPAAAAAALFSAGAEAADLGGMVLRGSDVVAPPPHHVDKWSGVYVGGQVGVQFLRNRGFHGDALGTANPNYPNFSYDYGQARIAYGLHIGFQKLFGHVLLGAEADFEGPSGAIESPWYWGNPFYSGGQPGNIYKQRLQSNWQGSVRARLGFTHHKSLFYLTGGLAFGNFTHCTIILNCSGQGPQHVVRYSATRWGWTIGGGIEHRFSYNWSARLEYRYTHFGSRNCLGNDPCSIDPNASDIGNQVDSHAVRVGVSYLFGAPPAPAPVVARY